MTDYMSVSNKARPGVTGRVLLGGYSAISVASWIDVRSTAARVSMILGLAVSGPLAAQSSRNVGGPTRLTCVEVRIDHVDSSAFIFGLDTEALARSVRDRLHQAGIATFPPRKAANSTLVRAMQPIVALAIHVNVVARGEDSPLAAAGVSVVVRREPRSTGAHESILWAANPPLRLYPTLQVATRTLSVQALALIDTLIADQGPNLAHNRSQAAGCP